MPDYVKITIDGKEIPIKDFVQDIIGQGLEGMVKTLSMVPSQYTEMNVTIQPGSRPKRQ